MKKSLLLCLIAVVLMASLHAVADVQMDYRLVQSQGSQSMVKAYVGLDEDGRILSIRIDTTGETNGIGSQCMHQQSFADQFIGQTIPVMVDAIAGATVTSNAVIDAVNSIVLLPEGETYTASALGYSAMVTVTVAFDSEGRIAAVKADCSGEINGYGTRCGVDQSFLNRFIGQTIPVQVDALSGATMTSNAVVAAVNSITPQPRLPEDRPAHALDEPAAEPGNNP